MGKRKSNQNGKKTTLGLNNQVDSFLTRKMDGTKSPKYRHNPLANTINTKEQAERRKKLYKKSDEEISELKTRKSSLKKGDLGSK